MLYSLLYAVGGVIDQDFTDLSAPLVQAVAWVPVITVMQGWSRSMFPGTTSELAAFSPANSPCSYIEEPPTSVTIERTKIRHMHVSAMYDELQYTFFGCFCLISNSSENISNKCGENTSKEPNPASLNYKIHPAVSAVIGSLLSQVALPQM